MLLCDKTIRELCVNSNMPMIDPFTEAVSGGGVVSYGLTSSGYDVRLGPEVFVFKNIHGEAIDPKLFGDEEYRSRMLERLWPKMDGSIVLPPHAYALARTFEYFRIPRHLAARFLGKSTYARSGILINTTPGESEWCGHLTLEIGNVTPCQVKIYPGEGIAQAQFEMLDGIPEKSYADKKGVYQNQTGVTAARVKA